MRSVDGGRSWRFVFGDATSDGNVPRILLDNNGTIWFIANWVPSGVVFHSTNGGLTWRNRTPDGSQGPRGLLWDDVSVTPDGRVWLVATQGSMPDDLPDPRGESGVVVSSDSGETWQRVSPLGPSIAFRFLPAGDTLYAVSQEAGNQLGVFRLRLGRSHWDEIVVSPGIAGGLSATLDDEGRLVVGTAGTGVWRMEW
jgi:photosystem II stability/assembly factor-like uncharacterized protein